MKKYLIIWANIVFALALCPYVFPVVSSDLQPWALGSVIIFLMLFLYEKYKTQQLNLFLNSLSKPFKIVILIMIYAFTLFSMGTFFGTINSLTGIKVFSGFLSLVSFALVAYLTWEYVKPQIFFSFMGVWVLALIAQIVWGTHVLAPVLSRLATSGYRGFTSLSSEPAGFATILATFIILNEFFFRENRYGAKWYIAILLLLITEIALSFSGVGLVLLILFVLAKFAEFIFIYRSKKAFVLVSIGILVSGLTVLLFLFNPYLVKTRGGDLLHKAIHDPIKLYKTDVSISYRASNPIMALYGGLIETHGFGFGIGPKEDVGPIPRWLKNIHGEDRTWGGRIEGGLVSPIYHLGVIGLLYMIVILYIVISSIKKERKIRGPLLLSSIIVFFPFVIFGPLSLPTLGWILGIHLRYGTS